MFRTLATTLLANANPNDQDLVNAANQALTGYHPITLADYLERFWLAERNARTWGDGVDLVAHRAQARFEADQANMNQPPPLPEQPLLWHHLVYALLIENTRILDVFERVIFELQHGERLPSASQRTLAWARSSEELFFTAPRAGRITSLASSIRPDDAAIRRNAYYRLLGMDVLHPGRPGRGAPYVQPEIANRDFSTIFSRLLREIWRGFVNRNNAVGENRTDDVAIMELVRRLREILTARRAHGALSREEFAAVATMSWFHCTVEYNTVVVVDLASQSTSAADRLRRLGERVGVPIHSRADSFFQLADVMSAFLIELERGEIERNAADELYADGGMFSALTRPIITHWSIVTGENIKEAFDQPAPRTIVSPALPPRVVNGNGSRIPAGLS